MSATEGSDAMTPPSKQPESSPLPVMGLWIGDALPTIAKLSIASFLGCGHPYILYSYGQYPNLPKGAEMRDANQIIPQRFTRRITPAAFSDWFRWELLSRHSGWYADIDTVCLKHLDIPGNFVVGVEESHGGTPLPQAYAKRYHGGRVHQGPVINTALTKAAGAPHPLARRMLHDCRYPERRLATDIRRWRLRRSGLHCILLAARFAARLAALKGLEDARILLRGEYSRYMLGLAHPQVFTDEVVLARQFEIAQPPEHFYPVHWRDWKALFDDTYADVQDPFPQSYTVHLWNRLSNQAQPSPNSFVARMLRKYGLTQPNNAQQQRPQTSLSQKDQTP